MRPTQLGIALGGINAFPMVFAAHATGLTKTTPGFKLNRDRSFDGASVEIPTQDDDVGSVEFRTPLSESEPQRGEPHRNRDDSEANALVVVQP